MLYITYIDDVNILDSMVKWIKYITFMYNAYFRIFIYDLIYYHVKGETWQLQSIQKYLWENENIDIFWILTKHTYIIWPANNELYMYMLYIKHIDEVNILGNKVMRVDNFKWMNKMTFTYNACFRYFSEFLFLIT